MVTKADKGNAVVIMNKDDYNDKIFKLLSDKSKFECIDEDLTIKRENSLLYKLDGLKKDKVISQEVYDKIRPTGSRPGIIYGLPKVHKDGYPLRPIISSSGTYNYNLAKFLDDLIKPLIGNTNFMLKDTFDFVNKISKICPDNLKMVSFDIESLFTNIPLLETINIIVGLAFKDGAKTFHGFS